MRPDQRRASLDTQAQVNAQTNQGNPQFEVPKGHVYRLTRDGLIPAVRLGRYYRYRLEAIERWEARSEQGPVIASRAA